MSARVAAIDIGTNSVLLLVAERSGATLVPVLERATITRLGRGVDRSRALDPEAVTETLACLATYADEARRAGVTRLAAVGTSAMRDARGGEDLRTRAREILGVAPEVISGDEEAALTFAGALEGLDLGQAAAGGDVREHQRQGGHDRPVLVFDLGGGSCEIVRGDARGAATRAVSLDVGAVRSTERHVHGDPPREDEIAAVRREARAALEALGPELVEGAPQVVGVAGTVTTLAAHALGVAPYDAARVHGARLDKDTIARALAELAGLTLAARRALPAVDPRRADVLVAGAAIVDELLAWARAGELVVSDRGVRWGVASRLAFTDG